MKRASFLLGIAALVLAGQAEAQTPDKLCEGLRAVLSSAGEASPFSSLTRNATASFVDVEPAGMEGAYSCSVVRAGAAGSRDQFDCLWIFPGAAPGGATTSIGDRVKACLSPSGWSAGKVEQDRGANVQTFTRTGSRVEVVVIEAQAGSTSHSARLSVSAPKKS